MIRAFSLMFVLFASSTFAIAETNNEKVNRILQAELGSFRAPIPGMSNSVGYLTLNNVSNSDITLIGAKSAVASRVEFHDHEMKNGVMKMFKVEQLTIKANQSLVFESGGLHLMFLGLKDTNTDQKTIIVELVADNGMVIPVSLQVKSIQHHHSHH